MAEQFSVSFLLQLKDMLSTPLGKVGAAFDDLDKKFSAASGATMKMGKHMTAVATMPILGWAAFAGHEAGEVNRAFREMGHSLEGLSADQLAKLRTGLLDLSKEVPRSAEELAGYAEMAGKMNELGDVKGFAKFLSAFTEVNKDMGGQESIAGLMDMMKALQLTQGEYEHTGDVITTLAQKFNTTAGAIVQGTLDLSHLKMTTKVTNDELMALSAWTDTIGSTGGMAMKQFTRVMSDAAQAKDMLNLAIMTKVVGKGTNTADFQREFEKSPARMVQRFLQGMAGMKDNGQIYEMLKIMDKLGLSGNRVQGFFLRGAGAAENLGKILDTLNDKQEVNGRMVRDAAENYEDFGNQMKMLWNAVKDFARQFGDDIRPVMEWLVGAVKDLVDIFTKLPAPLRYAVEGILGIVAAIGSLLMGVAALKGGLAALGASPAVFAALGAALPVILALTAAVGGLAAAGYELHKHWNTIFSGSIGAFFKDLGGFIGNTMTAGYLFNADSRDTLGYKEGGWFGSGAGGTLAGGRGEATIRVELDKGLKNAGVQSRGSVLPEVNTDGYAGLRFAH